MPTMHAAKVFIKNKHRHAEGRGSRARGPAAEGARGGARSRGPSLQPFVVTSLVQLLCRTTKLCWFDDDHFSRIVEDAKRLLEKGSQGGSHVRPGLAPPAQPASLEEAGLCSDASLAMGQPWTCKCRWS